MSAVPDIDDDFDSFDLYELEKRLSFAVGYAFQRAYLEEDEFTKKLAALRVLLADKQTKFETFNIGDASNMFLGTSYRAAKTSRLIFEEAQIRTDNLRLHGKLMLIHHDLIDGVVHPLYSLMNYFKRPAVLRVLGVDANSVQNCFECAFGGLFAAARHALSHEDERMVLKDVGDEDLESLIKRTQFRGTTGSGISGLHRQNSDGASFTVEFSDKSFLQLLDAISNLVKK